MKKINKNPLTKVSQGVKEISEAVWATMGPKGNNVIIERPGMSPLITKDGVSVAKEISFDDNEKEMGAHIVRDVSEQSNVGAGDGTTTACVLLHSVLDSGIKAVNNGAYAADVKIGINKAVKVVTESIEKYAEEIAFDDIKAIKNIATISANNDEEIGEVVSQAFSMIGEHGAVSVEEGNFKTEIEKLDGFHFDKGMTSSYFSSSPDKAEVNMMNPIIFFVEGKVTNTDHVIPFLQYANSIGKPVLIVAEDFKGDALQTLIMNKVKGGHEICAVQTPGFSGLKTEYLLDMSAMCSGLVIGPEYIKDLSQEELKKISGSCSSVKVDGVSTVLMGCKVNDDQLALRVQKIKNRMKDPECTSHEADRLQVRIAKMTGGVALIKVGAPSEVAAKELKDRVVDAKEAVIAALEEGVVPGGGSTLLKMSMLEVDTKNDDEKRGARALMDALKAPARIIANNAGMSPDLIVSQMITSDCEQLFNAKDMIFENVYGTDGKFKTKVLDPKKVTRLALENAASAAGTLLTSSVSVTIKK